jgi:hypothetical protein
MGNKYGGLKQLEGIGPNGETILDFSIYDAVRVGFNKIVFVISRHFEQEFKKLVSGKYEHVVEVEYVYQDVETIPEEKRNPKRKALYGSVRAVLMGEELIDSPFGVINAVNFYQRESFELLYNNLVMLGEAETTTEPETTTTGENNLELGGRIKITADTLYVREEASADSSVLGMASTGDEFYVLGKEGDWVLVNYQGNDGYIKAEFAQSAD